MSEDSIDIDVNFHLNDINNLFEQFMKGESAGDVMENLKKKKGDMMSSLASEIGGVEDETAILKALNEIHFSRPLIDDLTRIMNELEVDTAEQGEMLEGTKKNIMSLLGISQTILTMLTERFPLSDDFEEEIQKMRDIANDQKLLMDDKVELLMRELTSMLQPVMDDSNRAFKIIRQPVALSDIMGENKIKNISDEIRSNMSILQMLVEAIDNANQLSGRMRTREVMENLDPQHAINTINEIINNLQQAYTDAIDEARISRLEGATRSTGFRTAESTNIIATIDKIREISDITMSRVKEIVDTIQPTIEEFTRDATKQIEDAVNELELSGQAVDDLITKITEVKISDTQIKRLMDAIEAIGEQLADKIPNFDAEFDRIIERVLKNAVDKGFMDDPGLVSHLKQARVIVGVLRGQVANFQRHFEVMRNLKLEDVNLKTSGFESALQSLPFDVGIGEDDKGKYGRWIDQILEDTNINLGRGGTASMSKADMETIKGMFTILSSNTRTASERVTKANELLAEIFGEQNLMNEALGILLDDYDVVNANVQKIMGQQDHAIRLMRDARNKSKQAIETTSKIVSRFKSGDIDRIKDIDI